jgi:hypothetical protein
MTVKLAGAAGNVTLTQQMMKGDDGGYYYPSIDEAANLSWVASESGMAAPPQPINIAGPAGPKGDTGIYVGAEEPAKDVLVWLNPEGEASENLATVGYVDEAIANVEVDLSEYYTRTETDRYFATIGYGDDAIENINIPDVSGYALKSEIPDVSNFATKDEIPEQQDLSNYYTKSEIDALIPASGEEVSY